MNSKYFGICLMLSAILICILEYLIDIKIGDGDGIISNFLFIKLNKIYFFCAISLGAFFSIKNVFAKQINDLLAKGITGNGIYLFRLLYGLVIFSLAIQNKEPLIFLHDDFESANLQFLYRLNLIWLVNSILIIVGFGGRIPYIINFLLLPSLLHGDVGREQLKVIGFWMIFMDLHGKYSIDRILSKNGKLKFLDQGERIKYWPVWFAVINVSLTVTQAGLSKALDPFWWEGTGYYYTFLNHWLKHTVLFDFMLENKFVMLCLNYGTLITEIVTLPFILIPRLRRYGVYILFVMFLMLTFVFRIDPIGPSGLLLAFLSIFTLPQFHRTSSIEDAPKNAKRIKFNRYLLWISSSLLLVQLLLNIFLEWKMGRLAYPMVNYPFVSEKKIVHTTIFDDKYEMMESIYGHDPRYKLNIAWYTVFNFHNFLGRGIYKVVAETENGTLDISKVFNEDGTTNYYGPGGGILRPRVIQDRLTYIHYSGQKLAYYGSESLAANEIRLMRETIKYFVNKSDVRNEVKKAHIFIKTLKMPSTFQNGFNSMSGHWQPIYSYDVRKDTFMFTEPKRKLTFTHLQNKYFNSGTITYLP